jgi:accessory secretory protein Asp2
VISLARLNNIMDKIRILQIGTEDWAQLYNIPSNVKIIHSLYFTKAEKDIYEIVYLDRNIEENEFEAIKAMSHSYCLFVEDSVVLNAATSRLFNQRMGKRLRKSEIQSFLDNEAKKYFPKPYGEKFNPEDIGIAQGFKGKVNWNGQYSVHLEGIFGDELRQIVFWRGNIPIEEGQAIDFWLEYKKSEGVEISLSIKQFVSGSLSKVMDSWDFSESELRDLVRIEGRNGGGVISCSIRAKGSGSLDIIGLHDRISRWDVGTFMVGGERYVTSEREEIFAYFDPGDLKPPLAVYFSGYKTMEGFEGYHMMRKMGCPFLLISEQRFEGGGFYLGSEEYEKLMVSIIDKYVNKLGFYSDEVILSGISMGTIGSLYYGCRLKPHALILGKPLASLGDVAKNERLKRPGGFPTSLDLLMHYAGKMDDAAIEKLNERVWSKIRETDFGRTY